MRKQPHAAAQLPARAPFPILSVAGRASLSRLSPALSHDDERCMLRLAAGCVQLGVVDRRPGGRQI